MKVYTVTENNLNYIYGRLIKFFYNNNKTGFERWHTFDCGFKKHIPREIVINGEKVSTSIDYPRPLKISGYSIGKVKPTGKDILDSIVIIFTATDSDSIHIGDKIAFMGNHIIVSSKWAFTKQHKYVYNVYQVKHIKYQDQCMLQHYARMQQNINEKFLIQNE